MAKAKAKRAYRLRKNPEIADYVVESTEYRGGTGVSQAFKYFSTRKQARDYAKTQTFADRVRVFHTTFKLVSDRRK